MSNLHPNRFNPDRAKVDIFENEYLQFGCKSSIS